MKYLLMMALACPAVCFAQIDSIPKVDGDYSYSEVVKLDSSFTKDNLYRNSKLYFTDNYTSAKDVIQYDEKNKDEGRLIGKGFSNIVTTVRVILTPIVASYDLYYTTEIISKDGRYKYRIYNIYMQSQNGKFTINELLNSKVLKKIKTGQYDNMVTEFNRIISQIKSYMNRDVKEQQF